MILKKRRFEEREKSLKADNERRQKAKREQNEGTRKSIIVEREERPKLKTLSAKKPAEEKKKASNVALTLDSAGDISFMKMEHLLYEFSVRWSYALPPWPPADFDYTERLREQGLRKVDNAKFKNEHEIDEATKLKKVYQHDDFAGRFKDSEGKNYNLRPMETCPSLTNFAKLDRVEL